MNSATGIIRQPCPSPPNRIAAISANLAQYGVIASAHPENFNPERGK